GHRAGAARGPAPRRRRRAEASRAAHRVPHRRVLAPLHVHGGVRHDLRPRRLPIGEHPLDWDRGHMLGFDAVWRGPHAFTFAWVTQIASGARWTPTVS